MTNAQIEQRRRAGKERAKSFTTAYQAAAGRKRAENGDMSKVGYSGYVSCVGKYGYRGWLEKSRKTRLAKPTDLEKQVERILNRLGVVFDREAVVLTDTERPLVVDFAIYPGPSCIIEVHGRPHTEPGLNHGDPNGRRDRDEARFKRLREAGYRVCVIDHRLIDRAEQDIRAFLAM
jgi:hypothetical protein